VRGETIEEQRAQHLRKNLTDAERILWRHLRDRRLGGWKFQRQHAVGPFIVDFVCLEKKLVIEVDGGQHTLMTDQDAGRAECLRKKGYEVLRFWNNEVLQDTVAVLQEILFKLSEDFPPHPTPLPQGGEGKVDVAAAAGQFTPRGTAVLDIREYGNGNVNDTFLVTVAGAHPPLPLDAPAEKHFILQRLNLHVFPRPELVMRNLSTFSEHVRRRLERHPLGPGRRWEMPRVLITHEARDCWIDPDGSFWRAMSFIEGAQTFDTIEDLEQAREVGYALGMFHNLLSDLPVARLADTLPGFHLTPGYLRHYDEVLAKTEAPPSPEVEYCLRLVRQRRPWAHVLEEAKAHGRLKLRPIHGDPKVNNVMMDTATGQAVSLVDLDTVKPGLVHYDIGDCLRSGCNPLGEETGEWQKVSFEAELCQAMLRGYLALAREFFTENDYAYLYDAIRGLAFELGLRFFTDYLAGNVYFKVRHREHNLARALVQLRLSESNEAQEGAIRANIEDEARKGARARRPLAPA
jgi:very-short-patch-repair endonuclease/Ser/Thr protein kinase RdoA (MazF antagonist)